MVKEPTHLILYLMIAAQVCVPFYILPDFSFKQERDTNSNNLKKHSQRQTAEYILNLVHRKA